MLRRNKYALLFGFIKAKAMSDENVTLNGKPVGEERSKKDHVTSKGAKATRKSESMTVRTYDDKAT